MDGGWATLMSTVLAGNVWIPLEYRGRPHDAERRPDLGTVVNRWCQITGFFVAA
jgi:hypothetical protein